jgi:signal transduction histidine kinase
MRQAGKPGDLLLRRRPSSRSVRVRLTALYGGLFLLSGAALLTITYLLVRGADTPTFKPAPPSSHLRLQRLAPGPRVLAVSGSDLAYATRLLGHQHRLDVHQLLVESGIALGVMVVVSVVLGWLVAGRVLSPLQTITARTRRISEENLHDRLALGGPRDELTELADTIDALLARLEAAFESQRRFVANASHELRTPMAMMRTRLDVAVAKPDGVPPQTRALDTGLRKDLDRADRLLESFLVLARAQHGTLTDRTVVSLDRIVIDALATRRDQIAEQHLELRTALAPVRVSGSETLLTRMVENAIENSVCHNKPHGFINISCEATGEVARLVVESGGPVLDEDSVAQLAEPFRRLGADRTGSQKGQGLGLSIVAAVATAHDGALELRARPQGGLRVQITLPAATHALTTPVPA